MFQMNVVPYILAAHMDTDYDEPQEDKGTTFCWLLCSQLLIKQLMLNSSVAVWNGTCDWRSQI